MLSHRFHEAIGRLINKEKYQDCEIWMDRACDPRNGHKIYLYKDNIRYSDVDILIVKKKGPGIIIEIEESNVKPINLFGKFFAAAFSDHYQTKDTESRLLGYPMLFIQVVLSELKTKSKKSEQWYSIEKIIQDTTVKSVSKRIKEYSFFQFRQIAPRLYDESQRFQDSISTFLKNPYHRMGKIENILL